MLNMDFSDTVVISALDREWVKSPAPGVERKPLAREEAERGHATSVVRYLPGASFRAHNHPKGEEILVLEGVFSDETGDYGPGSYFRNPKGFKHAPYSKEGCVIFVKLHQFQDSDSNHVCVETDKANWSQDKPGLSQLSLHQHINEKVRLYKIDTDADLYIQDSDGIEIFVLSGKLAWQQQVLQPLTWLRSAESSVTLTAQTNAVVWVKTGHFPK